MDLSHYSATTDMCGCVLISLTPSQCCSRTDHHLPETVDSVLRVVKLDCRAGSQIQGSNGFLTLQQRHCTDYMYTLQAQTPPVCLVLLDVAET